MLRLFQTWGADFFSDRDVGSFIFQENVPRHSTYHLKAHRISNNMVAKLPYIHIALPANIHPIHNLSLGHHLEETTTFYRLNEITVHAKLINPPCLAHYTKNNKVKDRYTTSNAILYQHRTLGNKVDHHKTKVKILILQQTLNLHREAMSESWNTYHNKKTSSLTSFKILTGDDPTVTDNVGYLPTINGSSNTNVYCQISAQISAQPVTEIVQSMDLMKIVCIVHDAKAVKMTWKHPNQNTITIRLIPHHLHTAVKNREVISRCWIVRPLHCAWCNSRRSHCWGYGWSHVQQGSPWVMIAQDKLANSQPQKVVMKWRPQLWAYIPASESDEIDTLTMSHAPSSEGDEMDNPL